MKEILKLLENIKSDLAELALPSHVFTVSTMIYARLENGATRTGQLRFKLDDVLEAAEKINTRLNKVSKLEKKLAALEKKVKK